MTVETNDLEGHQIIGNVCKSNTKLEVVAQSQLQAVVMRLINDIGLLHVRKHTLSIVTVKHCV